MVAVYDQLVVAVLNCNGAGASPPSPRASQCVCEQVSQSRKEEPPARARTTLLYDKTWTNTFFGSETPVHRHTVRRGERGRTYRRVIKTNSQIFFVFFV